jgi:hypothetical protein
MIDWQSVLDAAVKVIGFVMTVVVSAGVMFLIYRALSVLLGRLIGDKVIVRAGTVLAMVLLGIKGLGAALRYITQDELRYLHQGLTGLLNDMAGVVQWLVLVVSLLFVGYTIRGWRGPVEQEEEEEEEKED